MDPNNDFPNSTVFVKVDDDQEMKVNMTALIFAIVALIGTFAQVLQQYIASAAGYSNCGESVMGEWHKSKKRAFRATELRFEVQFETPVIFICPPTNTKGPIPAKPIYFVDGSDQSLKDTRALLPKDEKSREERLASSKVHTADNERATWVNLLSQLQSMERESQEWQKDFYGQNPPLNPRSHIGFRDHTLAIAMQVKKRSWDNMPTDIKKPYATTAICHLLELAAIMGIYWQEFDRSRDRYRAEGNGYMLTGTNVNDLGLVFTFQICGKSRFKENRVIPVDEVKDLCCGFVPTLFQKSDKDKRRVEFPNEDAKDLSVLQFGSMNEIAETMVLIDCNTNTANYFRSKNTTARHSHLFPVPFELLGMLGKTLHIRNSAYRMLPNPTPYHWDKNFFNLRRLIKEYKKKIDDTDSEIAPTPRIQDLKADVAELVFDLNLDKKSATPGYSLPLLNNLHGVLDRCDVYLKEVADMDLVRMVVREHFQRILKMINDPQDKPGANTKDDGKHATGEERQRAERFSELSAASPEVRQEAFMELYFYSVLPEVRYRAVTSYKRQQTTGYAPSIRSRSGSLETLPDMKSFSEPVTPTVVSTPNRPLSPALAPPVPSPGPPPPVLEKHRSTQSVPLLRVSTPTPPTVDKTTSLDTDATDIWCTLVLRMLCWLLLHDFNKKDVQIPKSELLGNRLPVYIA
ncbi:Mod-A protein [Podospora bellae-mahoneyi]|uniref:Mod-A protein n=1 Tax=Podospora bellae-mahoneyi TaxID=2093777 RepID=A0ABR0FK87_9PEZI|nr:Mod-A protein [Podospora bellae-mahoneyi]